jgi:diaminopimelate epimerase
MSPTQQKKSRRRRQLKFTKMQGLGNDFVVIDLVSQQCHINERLIQRLADRRFGIGCDQVLLVEPPRDPDVDFRYRIFNNDGQEVEQCGNGARCFARFVRLKKLTSKSIIRVETNGGVLELSVLDRGQVLVDMGAPILEPARIPFTADRQRSVYTLDAGGHTVELGAVSMGNPHAVILTDDIDTAPVEELGKAIQQHPDFPRQANIGFMQVQDRSKVRLRVYERGAGETLACGSGACAAVVSGILRDILDSEVSVELRGGTLNIRWDGDNAHVLMTGPASIVFEGQIRL